MDCADCGAATRVTRTTKVMKMTARVIECSCGARFETLERIANRLPHSAPKQVGSTAYVRTGSSLIPTGNHRRLSAITGDHGRQLGGLGGPISSALTLSDPDHDPILSVTPIRGRARESVDPPGFAEFWAAYPRKVARIKAVSAWIKINPGNDLIRLILEAISWQAPIFMAREPEVRPHPATWLNQLRWRDERPTPATAARASGGDSPLRELD